jgi:acetyltransferase
MDLERLFDPARIAVIGASRTEGKLGYEAMANAAAFDGDVIPVNPSASGSVFGEPFVDSVADIENTIDLALVCIPGPVAPAVVADCGAAGVGAAVVYAGGFAEAGEEGSERQAELIETAATHDIALLGPNTSGFVIPRIDLFASFVDGVERLTLGSVAVLAQSGGVAHQLAFAARREGRGLSAMVGLGNRANVGFPEAIRYFDADPATDAVCLHVEGTDRGRRLVEACRAARTPITAYKVGQSDVGAFAASHTGALTGDHGLYTAGFAQYGVSTTDSTTALLDGGIALAASPSPGGSNVGVVTAQAGPGIVIADRLQREGASLPSLSAATRDRIEDSLPGITYAENPVDTGRPMPEFGDVLTTVAEDDGIDIVLVYELFEEALGFPIEALDGLAARVGKPVLFVTEGPAEAMAAERRALEEAGVPVFTAPERGAAAAGLLARYASLTAGEGVSGDV